MSRIIIEKIDSDTKKALGGTTFKITNYNNTFSITKETNDDGIIDLVLPYDNYYLQEVLAPPGYATNNEKISFRITDETPLYFQIMNSKVPQLGMNIKMRNIGFSILFILLLIFLVKELNIFQQISFHIKKENKNSN